MLNWGYWTSTTLQDDPSYAWVAYLASGGVGVDTKSQPYVAQGYVLAVRDGE